MSGEPASFSHSDRSVFAVVVKRTRLRGTMGLMNCQSLQKALADASLPPDERKPQNSPYLIAKAWEALENWVKELKKENLDSLRAKKFYPLKNSGVTFF